MSRQLRVNKVFTPSPGIPSVPEDSIPSNSSSAGAPAGTGSIMDSISSTTSSSQMTTPFKRAQDKQKSVTFGKDKVEVASPAKSESNDKQILAGVVKWFDVKKGYGFIRSEIVGDVDIFVHQRDIHANGVRLLLPGEKVEFEIEREADGRFRALHVTGPGGSYVYGAENVNKLRTVASSRRVPRSPFWFGPPATPGPIPESEFRPPQNPVYPQPFSPSFVPSTPPISGVSPVPLVAYGGYPNPSVFPPSTPSWMSPIPTISPDYIPPYFQQRPPVYPFPVSPEYGPVVTGEEGLSLPHVLSTPQPQRIPHSDSDDLSSPYSENSRQQVRASPRALEIRDPPVKAERTDNHNFLSPQKNLPRRDSLEGHGSLRQSPGKTPARSSSASSSASSSPSMSRGSSRTRSSFIRRRRISGAAIDAILNGIDRSPQTSETASSSPISSNSKSLPTSRSASPTGPSSASSSAVSSVASSASTSRDVSPQSKEHIETEPRSDVKPKGLLPPDPKARAIYLKASQATGDKSTWWRKRVPQQVGSDSTVWVLNDGMFSLGDDARVLRELGFTHIVWIPE